MDFGKYITTYPTLVQIACDGKWEEAWKIPLSGLSTSIPLIDKYLTKIINDVAFEVIFEEVSGVYILGLKLNIHKNNLKVKTPREFLKTAFEEISIFKDFPSLLLSLDNKLIGNSYLLQGECDLIRIGVVNHWFSLGPIDLWKKGWPKTMSNENLKKLLDSNPKTNQTSLNYQCMSFIYNFNDNSPGLYHWLKSPCSKKVGDKWEVDENQVLKYLSEWQEFRIQWMS